jgi:hypothetical protein
MKALDFLLANRSQLAVLRVLCHAAGPLSGRAVQRAGGLSNRSTMVALHALVELRAVLVEPAGRRHAYTVNRRHYLVERALQPAFDAEDLFWTDVARTVRRCVRPRPLAAVATGPIAREEPQYGGRLLLTMLFSSGRNRLRALASLRELAAAVQERYALVVEHTLLDTATMNQPEYEPLWRRVAREGILLFGTLP